MKTIKTFAFGEVRIVDKDWVIYCSDPWERIPDYMWPTVKRLLKLGTPTRAIARIIGFDRRQVRRIIRQRWPELLDSPCACGLSRRHQGWCKVRFSQSKARQRLLRRMHTKAYMQKMLKDGWKAEQVRGLIQNLQTTWNDRRRNPTEQ